MAGILALGELADGGLQSITGELLAVGSRLDKTLGEGVGVALLGADPGGAANAAIAQGADRVYVVWSPILGEPQIDAHLSAFEQVCRKVEPSGGGPWPELFAEWSDCGQNAPAVP